MVTFLYIITALILLIKLYDKLTRFMVNEYNLVCYFGKKGAGKTSLIACLSNKYYKKGFAKCYATTDVKGCYSFDFNNIGSFQPVPNSVIFIDEIGLLFNNRNFKSFKPEWLYFFKMQRHYKCKVVVFSQVYDDCDKVIRNLFDEIHIVKVVARVFQMDRKISKKFDIYNYKSGDGESTKKGGDIIEVYKYSGLPRIRFIPRWFNMIDSYERVICEEFPSQLVQMDSGAYESSRWYRYYGHTPQRCYRHIKDFFNERKRGRK